MPSIAPIAAIVPSALAVANQAQEGDLLGIGTQLGVGAALVGFAVFLQDKFTKQRKEAEALLRAERDKAIAEASAANEQLISFLKEKLAEGSR